MKLIPRRPLSVLSAAAMLTTGLGAATVSPASAAQADTYRPVANDCSAGYVEFTFDDGPDVNTPQVLTALQNLNLRATFFVLGSKLANNPGNVATLADELAAGFSVQNHTFDHSSWT